MFKLLDFKNPNKKSSSGSDGPSTSNTDAASKSSYVFEAPPPELCQIILDALEHCNGLTERQLIALAEAENIPGMTKTLLECFIKLIIEQLYIKNIIVSIEAGNGPTVYALRPKRFITLERTETVIYSIPDEVEETAGVEDEAIQNLEQSILSYNRYSDEKEIEDVKQYLQDPDSSSFFEDF